VVRCVHQLHPPPCLASPRAAWPRCPLLRRAKHVPRRTVGRAVVSHQGPMSSVAPLRAAPSCRDRTRAPSSAGGLIAWDMLLCVCVERGGGPRGNCGLQSRRLCGRFGCRVPSDASGDVTKSRSRCVVRAAPLPISRGYRHARRRTRAAAGPSWPTRSSHRILSNGTYVLSRRRWRRRSLLNLFTKEQGVRASHELRSRGCSRLIWRAC
jgi:hypothetical protein